MQELKTEPAETPVALLKATADHIEAHGLLLGMFQFNAAATIENGKPLCGCLFGTMRHCAGLPPAAAGTSRKHSVMLPALKALEGVTLDERTRLGGFDGPLGLMAWSDHHADLQAAMWHDQITGVETRTHYGRRGSRFPVISALRKAAHKLIAHG